MDIKDTDNETDDDFKPSPREAFHTDPQLCEDMLRKVVSTVPLKIRSSQISMGSGLFAAEGVEAGREIYHSTPLMTAVDAGNETFCHYCLKDTGDAAWTTTPLSPAKACMGCKVARFCSKECQKAAWFDCHKDECKTILAVPMMKAQHLLAHRLIFWQQRKLITTMQGKAISFLENHFNEYTKNAERSQEITDIALAVRQATGDKANMGLVWKTVPALRTNCVRIRCPHKTESIGYALDLVTAVINHSCNPNAHVFFEDGQLRVRSLKKIAPGDEITICYIDPRTEVVNRRDFLKREHFFECSCKRCKSELREQAKLMGATGTPGALQRASRDILDLIQRTDSAIKHPEIYRDFEGLGAVEKGLRTITARALPEASSPWPDDMDPLPLARLNLAMMYLDQGNTVQALRHSFQGKLVSRSRDGGPDWVNEMIAVVGLLIVLGSRPPTAAALADKAFPSKHDILTVAYGYVCEVCRAAVKAFGSGSEYTKGVVTMMTEAMVKKPDAKPGTKEFKEQFEAAQGRMMTWAGVPVEYAIVLSA